MTFRISDYCLEFPLYNRHSFALDSRPTPPFPLLTLRLSPLRHVRMRRSPRPLLLLASLAAVLALSTAAAVPFSPGMKTIGTAIKGGTLPANTELTLFEVGAPPPPLALPCLRPAGREPLPALPTRPAVPHADACL